MKKFDDRNIKPILTPMQKQWMEIKKEYPEYIIFFRLGDFYETFREQAVEMSKTLNITLTSRKTSGSEWPLAGVPHHALDSYLSKMIEKGYKVAIVEQLEDPKLTKKIVKRGVVRLITRGTITEPESLNKLNNYLVSINNEDMEIGLSAIDLSTGEFIISNYKDKDLLEIELTRLNPAEILVEKDLWERLNLEIDMSRSTFTYRNDYFFDVEQGKKELCNHFSVLSLEGFGVVDSSTSVGAAGAILRYLKETQLRESFPNITKINPIISQEFMTLDYSTVRSLELIESLHDRSENGTLRQVLDNTKTSTGSRLLTYWLLRPNLNIKTIEKRLDATDELSNTTIMRKDLRVSLSKMSDIERIIGRVCLGRVRPRELISLKNSNELIPMITDNLSNFTSPLLNEIRKNLNPLKNLTRIIDEGIAEEVPTSLKDGNVIKDGYNEDLDSLRQIQKGGKSFLTSLEAREKQKTGIKTLKIRFNKVFGYYIEVSKSFINRVPPEYERKQTLVNAERYITLELKEYEEKILNAEEKILVIEEELYTSILKELSKFSAEVQQNAQNCATLDVLAAFAENAAYHNYVKPQITETEIIEIKNGRHPVIEQILPTSSFIPNNCVMSEDKNRILVITGPNMAGKSTYLRQVALITLMAHIGSFVPAESAKIGLTDRIFTRIGAHDVLTEHRSTFMVEMYECANILNNATEKSLVILDEVGRGTSTFDGVSLAWAITEYLHNNIGNKGPRTLLATHYHELTELEKILSRVKNYHVSVRNVNGEIHFLYLIKEGGIDESYGVHVASLAGLPDSVIKRANRMLSELHLGNQGKTQSEKEKESLAQRQMKTRKESTETLLIEKSQKENLMKEISNINVDKISPIEAINILNQLIIKIKRILCNK